MARCWKEVAQFRSDSLHTEWNYFVHVCAFKFCFTSLAQIEEYHAYFSQKVHPVSRDKFSHPAWDHEKRRIDRFAFADTHHGERQSKFDKLPLYLFEESKRIKVVKALEKALKEFSK
jgi:hypothetical protein